MLVSWIQIWFCIRCGSGSGSMRENMTHENRNKRNNFKISNAGCCLLRHQSFFCTACSFGQKKKIKIYSCNFYQFLAIQLTTSIRTRSGFVSEKLKHLTRKEEIMNKHSSERKNHFDNNFFQLLGKKPGNRQLTVSKKKA
jgi:hypothetical protein